MVLVGVVVGCSTSSGGTEGTQAAQTSSSATTETSLAAPPQPPSAVVWTIDLVLDPTEALTLHHGVSILATWGMGSTELAATDIDGLQISGIGTAPAQVTFTYPMPTHPMPTSGGDTVTWTQPVDDIASVVVRQPWRETRPKAPGNLRIGWQAAGTTADYIEALADAPGLTITSPIWWQLDLEGWLVDTSDVDLVHAVRARGIEIWPAIASLDGDAIAAAVADRERRSELVTAIASRVADLGVSGVNLDFEGYRTDVADDVVAFARELGDRLRESGGVLSIDITARSDLWVITPSELAYWSTAPQRRDLAAAADYIVLMAYDQHNGHRPYGPVASPPWVEEMVRYALRYVDPHRLILGVPFYFRLWDPKELDRPRAISVAAIGGFVEDGTVGYDKATGLERVDLPDGRFFWKEDAAGLASQRDLVEELGLAGLAGWRLGLDSREVWDVIGR